MKWKTFWQIALLLIIAGAMVYVVFPKRPSLDEIFKGKTTHPRDVKRAPAKIKLIDDIGILDKPTGSFIPDGPRDLLAESAVPTAKVYIPKGKFLDEKPTPSFIPDKTPEQALLNKAFTKAIKYIQDKQFKEAINDFNKLIEAYPENGNLYLFRAWAFWFNGQYDKAISDCDLIINNVKNPDLEVFLLRGHAYIGIHNYNAAIQDYEIAKTNPKYIDEAKQSIAAAYSSLGLEYYESYLKSQSKEDIVKAIDYYSKAIGAEPLGERYVMRGECHGWHGDYFLALQDFDSALNMESNNAAAFAGKADIYEKKGEPQTAIYNYKKAIELNPKGVYYYYVGGLYLKLNDLDSAIYYSTKAIDTGGKVISFAYYTRGVAYLFRKEYKQSYDDLSMAKSLGADVGGVLEEVRKRISADQEIRDIQDQISQLEYRGRVMDIMGQYRNNMQATRAQQAQEDYYRESLNLQRQAVSNQQMNQRGSWTNPIHVKVDDY